MKIAMVTEYLAPKNKPHYGGVDARTINLAKYLSKNNDVHIITASINGGKKTEDYDGVTIHRIGKKRKFTQKGSFLQRLKFSSQVIDEILRIKPDIVDGSGFVSYSGCYKAAEKIGIPSVVTVHEVWQGEWIQNMGLINGFAGHFLEKQYLKFDFNGYISVSDFTKEKLIKKLGIDKERITVVYNGIDLDLYRKTIVKEKYENPTIVTICRLVSYKRIKDLINALKLLKTDIPNIKLKIIGEGPHEKYLKNLTKNLELEDNVEFLGKINNTEDLIRILKKSHVFSLPSIAEGFGMAIVEAMAADLPYVASNILPIREVTQNGIGGLLHQPKNVEDLASKIKILLTDESIRDEKIKNASRHIQRYEWIKIAKQLENCYKKICNGGPQV